MKNIKKEALVWLQLGFFVLTWAGVLYFSGTQLQINWNAIQKLPDVVGIYAIIILIFETWIWRWPILQGWIVPFPDLQGTWEGSLKSTWMNPNSNKPLPPVPMILVIKQSFTSISCVMFTKESESYSTCGQINEDDDSGLLRLSFNYTNRPKATVRHRSEIHDGAAILKIIKKGKLSLDGEYWTSRKTTGDISLKFKSKKLQESFTK